MFYVIYLGLLEIFVFLVFKDENFLFYKMSFLLVFYDMFRIVFFVFGIK